MFIYSSTCGKTNLVSEVKRVVVSRDKSGLGVERAVSGTLEIFYMVGSWVYSVCEKSSSCMLMMSIYHCMYIILFKLFKSVKLLYLKGGRKQGEEDGLKTRLF